MKKLLMLLASIGLTATTTVSVVACGKNISKVNKIQLDSVLVNTTVSLDTADGDVISSLLALPGNSGFDVEQTANLEVKSGSFVPPTYTKNGSAIIEVKAGGDTNYTGSVKVIINQLKQTRLDAVLTSTIVDSDTTIDNVIAKVLALPGNLDFDASETDNLEVETGSFVPPTFTDPGSVVIEAKVGTKYTGLITITISAIETPNLEELGLIINIDGTNRMLDDDSGETILKAFLKINEEEFPDLIDNIEIHSYNNKVDYVQNGSLIIEGINKYEGTLEIVINKIPASDAEIVTIVRRYMLFFATMYLSENLDDFIDAVLLGGDHPSVTHYFLKSQLMPYEEKYPIFKAIDYDKFEFLGLFLLDKTPFDDAYIRDHNLTSGFSISLYVGFNYGTVQGDFMMFSLLFI